MRSSKSSTVRTVQLVLFNLLGINVHEKISEEDVKSKLKDSLGMKE